MSLFVGFFDRSMELKDSKQEQAEKQLVKRDVRKTEKSANRKQGKKILKDVAENTDVQRYMLSLNPYLQALLDPFNIHGVRIPDLVTTPSGTISTVLRNTMVCSAAGFGAIAFGLSVTTATGIFNSALGSLVPYPSGYHIGCVSGTGAANTDLFGAATCTNLTLTNWSASNSGIPLIYRQARLVSAGLSIRFVGNYTNCEGRILGVSLPRDSLRTLGAVLTTAKLLDQPGIRSVPVNNAGGNNAGLTLFYYPQDDISLAYTDVNGTYSAVSGIPAWARGGELIVGMVGCAASAEFEYVLCLNYEGIPLSSSMNLISTQVSPADPNSLAHATTTIAEMPKSSAGTILADGVMEAGLPSGHMDINAHMTAAKEQAVMGVPAPNVGGRPVSSPREVPAVQQQKSSFLHTLVSDILPVVKEALPVVSTIAGLF